MVERMDWGNGGEGGGRSIVPAVAVATSSDPLGAVALQREMESWGSAADVPADPGLQPPPEDSADQVVEGVGLTRGMIERLDRLSGGFEQNYGAMYEAALVREDDPNTPSWFVAEMQKLPPALREEALWFNMLYPKATLAELYERLKGKMTLTQAYQADKLMQRLTGTRR